MTTPDNTLQIQLTKGYTTQIDAMDIDLCEKKWHISGCIGHIYAARGGGNNRQYLHRVILERIIGRSLNVNEYVDHVDRDTLNNKRENLRLATQSENMRNSTKRSSNKSGYKGVSWAARESKWCARITVQYKGIHVGYFDTPEKAALAYNAAAIRLHGEFARLNDV